MDFSTYFAREGRAKKLYPVVHVRDLKQAETNTHIALEHGADGVFLINHDISSEMLLHIAAQIRRRWSDRFIGINLLDQSALHAWRYAAYQQRHLNAVWVDDSGIDDRVWSFAEHLQERMQKSPWNGYYFASVAFKGMKSVSDVGVTAAMAAKMAHIVVTSGEATGSAPSVEKIRTMKAAIPNHPLAIASGITCKNIHLFLPIADIIMAATGISYDFFNLHPGLVHEMATIIRNYNKSAGLLT